jgi:hypothetical protein
MFSPFQLFTMRMVTPVIVRFSDAAVRALDDYRVREYPHKTRGAVVRKGLEEFLSA